MTSSTAQRWSLILLFLSGTSVCWADNTEFFLGGYIKNINLYALYNDGQMLDEPRLKKPELDTRLIGSDLNRLRLESELNFGSYWHSEIWLDTELQQGLISSSQDIVDAEQRGRTNAWSNLTWTLSKGHGYHLQQLFPRALVTLETDQWTATIGRQRITWGTGFVWNPTDLLNPTDPLAVERAEKGGINAFYVARAIGDLSQIEVVLAEDDQRRSGPMYLSAATRVSGNLFNYDFSVLYGRFGKNHTFGGDFAGYLGNAGFRGELAYTLTGGALSASDTVRAILNADYNFPYDIYTLVEFHLLAQPHQRLSTTSPQLQMAAMVSKSITPLFAANLFVLFNADDRSMVVGPTFTFVPNDNIEFMLGSYLFAGDEESLYGPMPRIGFTSIAYHF